MFTFKSYIEGRATICNLHKRFETVFFLSQCFITIKYFVDYTYHHSDLLFPYQNLIYSIINVFLLCSYYSINILLSDSKFMPVAHKDHKNGHTSPDLMPNSSKINLLNLLCYSFILFNFIFRSFLSLSIWKYIEDRK